MSRLGDNAPAVRIDRVKDVLYCSVQTNVGHELARKRNHEHLTLMDVLNLFVQCVQLIDGFNEQNYYFNDDMLEGAQIFRDRDGQVSVWFPRIRPVQNRNPPSVEVFASFLNEFLQSGVELLYHQAHPSELTPQLDAIKALLKHCRSKENQLEELLSGVIEIFESQVSELVDRTQDEYRRTQEQLIAFDDAERRLISVQDDIDNLLQTVINTSDGEDTAAQELETMRP